MTTPLWLGACAFTLIVGYVLGHWAATLRYVEELRQLNETLRHVRDPYRREA